MNSTQAVAALSALAHDGRLQIFRLLVRAGPNGMPAGEIARTMGILPNTLSGNLNILSAAGLVHSRRLGRSIIYKASYEDMGALITFLLEDCCAGQREICGPLYDVVSRAREAGTSCC